MRLQWVRMYVVNFLPNHPIAPQAHTFEALLPELVSFIRFNESKICLCLDYYFRRHSLQLTDEFFDPAITRICN